MSTLKKFWMYFLMFVGFFLLVTLLTNFLMRDDYKNTNYEIKSESPVIEVTECKSAYSNGYIKGSVTNNTDKLIQIKYLKIDLYNEDDVYLGSEYKELKYFNPQETISFDINYKYTNVKKIVLGFTDNTIQNEEKEKNEMGGVNVEPIITEDTIRVAAPIGMFLVFHTALGLF